MADKQTANVWRGERALQAGGHSTILSTTMDDLARIFTLCEADDLGEVFKRLSGRHPKLLKAVYLHLAHENGEAVWQALPGIVGLNQVHDVVLSTIMGLTPEEEKEAEKKRQDSAAGLAEMANRQAAEIIALQQMQMVQGLE